MCKTLKVSSNSFYNWRSNKSVFISSKVSELKEMIRVIFHENRCVYGAIRIQKALERSGFKYSVSYVSRLMKMMNIRSKIRKKYVITTDSNHSFSTFSNELNREFEVNELGKVWVSDITYIRVGEKWHYLTSMIDLADRQVVGWSISDNMTTADTVLQAWYKARRNRAIGTGFLLHSDRGVQYASDQFTKVIKANRYARQSMSRKGNCWDNAVAESFFKTIKVEMCNHIKFTSKRQLEIEVFKYINWYNNHRLHSTLGYKTPVEKQEELTKQKFINAA